MSIAGILKRFDEGIEKAQVAFEKFRALSPTGATPDRLAGFTFYDHDQERPAARIDGKLEEPFLWKEVHKPVSEILKADPATRSAYAGFATLFTLDRSKSGKQPFYYSMAFDVELDAAGFANGLPLTNHQFNKFNPNRPFGLTALCLNGPGHEDFVTKPIIFYWKPRSAPTNQDWGKIPDALRSWAHVFVTADIPEDHNSGITTSTDWSRPETEFLFVDEDGDLTRETAIRRLARCAAWPEGRCPTPEEERQLLNRLAWGGTYFAYGCRCIKPGIMANKPEPYNHFTVICVPASFERIVTAAFYVPCYLLPNSDELSRAAQNIIYIARTLGLPLEKLKTFRRGEAHVEALNAHQTSAVIDSIAKDIASLPSGVKEALGGSLVAKIHILRAIISSHRENETTLDGGDFPIEFNNSTALVNYYIDLSFQLGMTRAQDAPQLEVSARDFGALLNEPGYEFQSQKFNERKNQIVEPIGHICNEVLDIMQRASFAVLFILALKQAIFHTIRAAKLGSTERLTLNFQFRENGLTATITNPSAATESYIFSKDALELAALASRLSGIGKSPLKYGTMGTSPKSNSRCWTTSIEVTK